MVKALAGEAARVLATGGTFMLCSWQSPDEGNILPHIFDGISQVEGASWRCECHTFDVPDDEMPFVYILRKLRATRVSPTQVSCEILVHDVS